MRVLRSSESTEAGYLWATADQPERNRWNIFMPVGGNDLRWAHAVSGTCMQLSGTDGSLTVSKAATFSASTTTTGTATATQVVARGSGIGGTVRAAPATNGNESSIGFYRNSDQSGSAAGDQWVLGQGSWGVGAGNFSIGTLARGSCLTINATTGIANLPYGLSVANQGLSTMLDAMKPHSAGLIDTNGTVLRDNGKYPFTVSRAGPTYTVNLPVPYEFQYGVIATLDSPAVYAIVRYGNRTSTSFTLAVTDGLPTTISFLMLTYDSGLG
jgi:hypothetical protein